jgi:hypothetical protein
MTQIQSQRDRLRRQLNENEEIRNLAAVNGQSALAARQEAICRRLSDQLDALPEPTPERTHLDGWPLLPGEHLLGPAR